MVPKMPLIAKPKVTENVINVRANARAAFHPCSPDKSPKVVALVAGPVIRNAMAAPGESPPTMSAATKGVADDGQT